jgi:hypothetical protein
MKESASRISGHDVAFVLKTSVQTDSFFKYSIHCKVFLTYAVSTRVCIFFCFLELSSCTKKALSKTIDCRIMLTKVSAFYPRTAYSQAYFATSRKEMD